VCKIKYDNESKINHFKAPLIRQKYGIDYNETFSPIVRYESIKTILAIAAAENYELKQFDIKTT